MDAGTCDVGRSYPVDNLPPTTSESSTPAAPRLLVRAGTQFGYHTGLPWNRREHRLIVADQDLATGAGLHLFVAPNGSGKTTLLRTLAGLLRPLSGSVHLDGRMNYFSDELRMDGELKPALLFRCLYKRSALEHAMQLARTLKLDVRCPIGKLSRGNRQKVLLIMAETQVALHPSSVLLMDEPLTGLDAETREIVTELWAGSSAHVLRLVVLHELESVHAADSLITVHDGRLKRAPERVGATWLETYHSLRS